MSRDSGSGDPSQRTVAELLAEHGGGSQRGTRRRRRRAEDPSETAPQAIIERVNSDSGRMRPVVDSQAPPPESQSPESQPPAAPSVAPPSMGARRASPQAPPEPPQSPPPPVSGPSPSAEQPAEAAPPSGGGNFWARRFAATNGPARSAADAGTEQEQAADVPPEQDPEATAQQPSLAARTQAAPAPQQPVAAFTPGQARQAPPAPPATPPGPVEGATEQFEMVESAPPVAEPSQHVADSETALLAYPDQDHAYGANTYEADPYGSDYYEEAYESDYDSSADDGYGVGGYADDPYADDDFDDDEQRLPAGLGADDHVESVEVDQDTSERSSAKEWLVLGTQVGGGLVAGGLVWFGFQWLWTAIPVAALVAALVVTGALVLVARRILRTDDLQTILLAVLVGLVCTVSPAALLLVGY